MTWIKRLSIRKVVGWFLVVVGIAAGAGFSYFLNYLQRTMPPMPHPELGETIRFSNNHGITTVYITAWQERTPAVLWCIAVAGIAFGGALINLKGQGLRPTLWRR